MNKKLTNTKLIDSYLSGELSPEQASEFEKQLKEDPNVQEDTEVTKRLLKGIQAYGFREMLKKIQERHFLDDGD